MPSRRGGRRRRRGATHESCWSGGAGSSAASGGVCRALGRSLWWVVGGRGGGCCRRHLHTDTNPVRLGNNVTPARRCITGPGTRETCAKTNTTYAQQCDRTFSYKASQSIPDVTLLVFTRSSFMRILLSCPPEVNKGNISATPVLVDDTNDTHIYTHSTYLWNKLNKHQVRLYTQFCQYAYVWFLGVNVLETFPTK